MNERPDYVYAELSRAGLGNILFPWARALLAARQTDVPMIAPKWLRVRLGPYLRGETDKRAYWKLFRPPSATALAHRAQVLATATLLDETGTVTRKRGATTVQVFGVIDGYFKPLDGQREVIGRELRAIARPGVLQDGRAGDFVAVHVRLGDFARGTGTEPAGVVNLSTPVSWFAQSIEWLRIHGWDGGVVLFSDGTEEELAELTTIPWVRRHHSRNALDDMFEISRARLVIGSGSSFGAWGAFLGDIPIAVESGRNPFMKGSPRVHEIARWSDEIDPTLLSALFDNR